LRRENLAMGNPNPTRDFSYVDDIVRGYALLAEKGKSSEIYHLSSGVEKSVREITETIRKFSGVNSELSWDPGARRIDIPRSVGDFSKARRELGWQPQVSFEDGVKKTIEWYRSQFESRNHELAYVPNA
jgi:nucleoside-diphosphate-sugar epimerase